MTITTNSPKFSHPDICNIRPCRCSFSHLKNQSVPWLSPCAIWTTNEVPWWHNPQSAKVCTHRVRRPPFWLILTALDRNRYLPVYIGTSKIPASLCWSIKYINNNVTKDRCPIPLDTTVRLGHLKCGLQATMDHHGPSIHSGHYTASINCWKKHIPLQRSHNYGVWNYWYKFRYCIYYII